MTLIRKAQEAYRGFTRMIADQEKAGIHRGGAETRRKRERLTTDDADRRSPESRVIAVIARNRKGKI